MPNFEAIERGFNFEDRVADVLDGKKQPGSGNKFHSPSDVIAHGLLVSCKSEANLTWARIHKHLWEAVELAQGTGNVPALALDAVESEDEIVVMRLSDFAKAFSDGVSIPIQQGRGVAKRATADIPILLR